MSSEQKRSMSVLGRLSSRTCKALPSAATVACAASVADSGPTSLEVAPAVSAAAAPAAISAVAAATASKKSVRDKRAASGGGTRSARYRATIGPACVLTLVGFCALLWKGTRNGGRIIGGGWSPCAAHDPVDVGISRQRLTPAEKKKL
eukprot:6171822-Pleurochrysis_carterae.AAC.2